MYRPLDIVYQLASRVIDRDLEWYAALRASARERIVDHILLQQVCVELGDWAPQIFSAVKRHLTEPDDEPEELIVDDITKVNDRVQNDQIKTENWRMSGMTVNQLIFQLESMRDADEDVGHMFVMAGNDLIESIAVANVGILTATSDSSYVVVLR